MILIKHFLPILLLASPAQAITPSQVGLIINDSDPASIETGEYYRMKRAIPARNIVHVHIDPKNNALPLAVFDAVKAQVDKAMPASVQFLAIAWTKPSMVGACESMSSAMARGVLNITCGFDAPSTTPDSPYFKSSSVAPYTDYRMRPAMLLAGKTVTDVKKMIDRGVAADGTRPSGKAYIMWTSSRARSLRAQMYATDGKTGYAYGPKVDIELLHADAISGTTNTMLYFHGTEKLGDVTLANHFPPGAYVDNLSSFSGRITNVATSNVLNAVKGDGGATAYAGAVSEPFALYFKFPSPQVMIPCYLGGGSIIECAWKSLQQTPQILFIGEPMASPYATAPNHLRSFSNPSRSRPNRGSKYAGR